MTNKTTLPFYLLLTLLTALFLTGCSQPSNDAATLTPEDISGPVTDNAIKILITESAPYRVSLADLQSAGLRIDLDSFTADNLSLTTAVQEIPYLLEDDHLLFYGQAPDDIYLEARPYILHTGQAGQPLAPPTDLPTAVSPLTTVQQEIWLEENNIYTSNARTTTDTDTWFWHVIHVEQTFEIPLTLQNVNDGSGVIQINLWGQSQDTAVENDHDLDLVINGQTIETIRWDGQVHHTAVITLPTGTLQNGENSILLDNSVPGATFIDIMQLNWINLQYDATPTAVADQLPFTSAQAGTVTLDGFTAVPLTLDITDPASPTLLATQSNTIPIQPDQHLLAIGPTGWQHPALIQPLRASTLRDETNQADLLIIAHDDLIPPLDPLIAARQAQGLTVRTVPLGEIYDEFGYGQTSPESITNFLRHTQESWAEPAPRYLLLVGDGTYDYRNYLGTRPRYHLPSPLVEVVHSGETVSDARMADTDGDYYPNLAVGRWTANSPEAVAQLVERTLAYEQTPAAGRTLFTADGTSAEFTNLSDYLIENGGLNLEQTAKLYGSTFEEVATQWNDGAWLVNYVGHGSLDLWGKEKLFDSAAISLLNAPTNNTAVPIVLQFTCLTGFFAHPNQPSISENLLLDENGPVLLVAATSLTFSSQQQPFARDLLQNLQNPEYERMGDALQAAKLNLNLDLNLGLREISDTFGLLGDPSALIVRPATMSSEQ